jgi:shikimate dehydrogenase
MNNNSQFLPKNVPTFYFIGVDTSKSSIIKVFPLWMQIFGSPEVVIEGVDLNIHDTREAYCNIITQIKTDPLSLGALVSTHKIDLFNASWHLFDYLDSNTYICGALETVFKCEGKLVGRAFDPISAGLSLEEIIEPNYFEITGGEMLCFGAGGVGVALALHLIKKINMADQPRRFVFSNRSQWRLDRAKEIMNKQKTDIIFEYICTEDLKVNDRLMENMPPSSVVINATGKGKDIPGSPISWDGLFPQDGFAWEVNYRGNLDFLRQAKAQAENRKIKVEDGWKYFLNGWTQIISKVLSIPLTHELFQKLAKAADVVRK